jgi:hypothetical protein
VNRMRLEILACVTEFPQKRNRPRKLSSRMGSPSPGRRWASQTAYLGRYIAIGQCREAGSGDTICDRDGGFGQGLAFGSYAAAKGRFGNGLLPG